MRYLYPSDNLFPSDNLYPGGKLSGADMAAKAIPLSPTPAPSPGQVIGINIDRFAPSALFGWSLMESTGSAGAKAKLHDGSDASGSLLCVISITTNGGDSQRWFGDESIEVTSRSVYLEVVSGSLVGCVYLA